jgi:hypothetical protein
MLNAISGAAWTQKPFLYVSDARTDVAGGIVSEDVTPPVRTRLAEDCVALRLWYHHDPKLFSAFSPCYRAELTEPGRAAALCICANWRNFRS